MFLSVVTRGIGAGFGFFYTAARVYWAEKMTYGLLIGCGVGLGFGFFSNTAASLTRELEMY